MVAAEHAAARERGEVVALLYASEFPIYGRFGYGPATTAATWTLDPTATSFSRAADDGGIRRLLPTDEAGAATARDGLRGVARASSRARSGDGRSCGSADFGRPTRPASAVEGLLRRPSRRDGPIDGYARYHVEEKWEHRQPRNTLIVDDSTA